MRKTVSTVPQFSQAKEKNMSYSSEEKKRVVWGNRRKFEEEDRVVWSEQKRKEKLFRQRQFLWDENYLELFYNRLGLKPYITVADIGCGWGYIGQLLLRKILPGGAICGVDIDQKLIKQAIDLGDENTHYLVGDAQSIPLKSESVDLAICQAVLIHLADPKSAVAEMARIVKPGGKVAAIEANNILVKLASWDNLHSLTPERQIEELKYHHTVNKGRKNLKMGDYEIGSKVSSYMTESGLTDIEVHLNDSVLHLEPPYNTPEKEFLEKTIRQNWKEDFEKWVKLWDRDEKKFFLAGGGTEEEYQQRIEKRSQQYHKNSDAYLKALDQQTLVATVPRLIYITIGKKA